MSDKYFTVNIRVYLDKDEPTYIGEKSLYDLLSDFSCPQNPDVEYFLLHNADEGMPTGVYISEVSRGGGAADAGITKGSIIVGFNGITIDSMESLQEQLQYYKKGEKVTLTLQVPGDGGEYQEQTVDVTLGSKAQ